MYIVVETQTNNGSTAVLDPIVRSDINEAKSEYHRILSYAAVSSVEKHAVVILTDTGAKVDGECYEHLPEA